MLKFCCEYCGDRKAVRFGGMCPACIQEDRLLVRQAHKLLRQEGGMSLEEMALTLDITVCRIERWIKEKLIDRKLISDLAEKPVYAGSSVDLFLRRKSEGVLSRQLGPAFIEKVSKQRMATDRAQRGGARKEEAA